MAFKAASGLLLLDAPRQQKLDSAYLTLCVFFFRRSLYHPKTWSAKEILASMTTDAQSEPSAAWGGKLRGSKATIWECKAVGLVFSQAELAAFQERRERGHAGKQLDCSSCQRVQATWSKPVTYQSAAGWFGACLQRSKDKWTLTGIVQPQCALAESNGLLQFDPVEQQQRPAKKTR